MLQRVLICVLVMCMVFGLSAAEGLGPSLPWPETMTAAQQELADLIAQVNTLLLENRAQPFNTLFECYPSFAVLGVTTVDQADEAEDVELTAQFFGEHITKLELRVSNLRIKGYDRFPLLAGVLITCVEGHTGRLQQDMADPQRVASQAAASPDNSFGDPVSDAPGEAIRACYNYSPGLYQGDENNVLTLTLVIPASGLGAPVVTPAPVEQGRKADGNDDYDSDFEGYDPADGYLHYDVSVSPTPEPYIPYKTEVPN